MTDYNYLDKIVGYTMNQCLTYAAKNGAIRLRDIKTWDKADMMLFHVAAISSNLAEKDLLVEGGPILWIKLKYKTRHMKIAFKMTRRDTCKLALTSSKIKIYNFQEWNVPYLDRAYETIYDEYYAPKKEEKVDEN